MANDNGDRPNTFKSRRANNKKINEKLVAFLERSYPVFYDMYWG
jgi:hypothetical protein